MKVMSTDKLKEFKAWLDANPQANEVQQVEKYKQLLASDSKAEEVQ